MGRKTTTAIIVFFSVLLCTLAFHTASFAGPIAGKEIKIGGIFPITGHGANVGKREAIGTQAAVDVINAKGGVYGVPLKLFIEDTKQSPRGGECLAQARWRS